jgi:tetrahydromethanopterin S-methyltransferase subunit G
MMPPEFKALMERYCQLGRLLPDPDDIDEVHERADEIRLILEEMHSVQREIDRI